ncbi:MAG: hypothetical protein GY743_06900 [Planctomycetaceae bacterium]|nr:hypothetical protein [Planctomycetaceae bacterium]
MPVSRMGLPFHPADQAARDVVIGKKWKVLPDFFSINGEFGVSQAFKDLLEEMEPGVHQFFPLEIRRKDGGSVEGNYYVFVTCVLLDTALIPEKSNVVQKGTYREYPDGGIYDGLYYTASGPGPDKFTLNRNVIGNHHAWVDKRLKRVFFLMHLSPVFKISGLVA